MDGLRQDVRYVFRGLRVNPGLTALAVVILAIGIGAITAIFSVVDGVVLRPLPYRGAEELIALRACSADGSEWGLSQGEFLTLEAGSERLTEVAFLLPTRATLTGIDRPEHIGVAWVSENLFALLGAGTARGRTFVAGEGADDPSRVAVISHAMWQRRFGGDPEILGRQVALNGIARAIVGVMPEDFVPPEDLFGERDLRTIAGRGRSEVWLPATAASSDPSWGSHYYLAIGRLAPGASLAQAQAEADGLLAAALQQRGDLKPFFEDSGIHFALQPLRAWLIGDIRQTLWVLLAAVTCVLLIACANVANLLLIRAEGRQGDFAVRRALGATCGRVARHLLIESLVIASLGAIGGILIAAWSKDLLLDSSPRNLPRLQEVALDPRIFLFTLAVSLLAALIFGLAPALHAVRGDLGGALKEEGRGATVGSGRQRMRHALVVSEVAIAAVLACCAALLLRSFLSLQQVSPGFESQQLTTARISLPAARYPTAVEINGFLARLQQNLALLPGVRSAAVASMSPLAGISEDTLFDIEGRPPATHRDDGTPRQYADLRWVGPGYFDTLGIPLLRGRGFTAEDRLDSSGVVIVNESLARLHWGDEEAIGRRLRMYWTETEVGPWSTVVGVVADSKVYELTEEPRPELFHPVAQSVPSTRYKLSWLSLLVRGEHGRETLEDVRRAVWKVDAEVPVYDLQTMDEVISQTLARPRFNALLMAVFAAVALLLAVVGVYGVMSYTVAQRTSELGIRTALGARPRDLRRLVLHEGMTLAGLGLAVGLLGAAAASRALTGLLYGVRADDPTTYAVVVALLAAAAFLANDRPARRAGRIDPLTALRRG